MSTLRLLGVVLLLWAYGMNVHAVIGAWYDAHQSPEARAQEHLREMQAHPEMDMSTPRHDPLPLWRVVTTGILLAVGALLALLMLRGAPTPKDASGSLWMTVVVWLGIAVPRIVTDPRCWVAYDPHKHGCHTFLGSLLIAIGGIACCAIAQKKVSPQMTAEGRR